MDTQSALAGIFDQICGEDEAIREKGMEYVSTSLVQMRHKLFIPHPENEKFLVEMIKKVNAPFVHVANSAFKGWVCEADDHYQSPISFYQTSDRRVNICFDLFVLYT